MKIPRTRLNSFSLEKDRLILCGGETLNGEIVKAVEEIDLMKNMTRKIEGADKARTGATGITFGSCFYWFCGYAKKCGY